MNQPHATLHEIWTSDGLPLEGLLFASPRRTKSAVFWIGGLTSRFSKNPRRTNTLAATLNRRGIAFAIFDHRGADVVRSVKVLNRKSKNHKYILTGTGYEKFEHSLRDIEAIIRFLRKQGYRKLYLIGHSTGANKAAYYIYKTGGRALAGVALLGAVSDIPILKKRLGSKYPLAVRAAQKLVTRGQSATLMPDYLVAGRIFTAARFLSLTQERAPEDMFPYYQPRRSFRWTKRLRQPVLVLLGEQDESAADRSTKEILKAFEAQVPKKFYKGTLIKGADHSFSRHAQQLAKVIAVWVKSKKTRSRTN
ncbi:MAG: alpha/beta fold hydrolase [Parcubacteria group bacterium]